MILQKQIETLPKYVDYLQSKADYVFSESDAIKALRCSTIAFRRAAQRLVAKKRIARIRPAYYVIIPLEYKSIGAPTPPWYIDALMKNYYNLPYYVCLLTAAALHGAAHQQPQIFQVITTKPLKPVILPRTTIRFYVQKKINDQFLEKRNTPSGYMTISTAELTALDLVQYVESVGHLNNVATVLIELAESINIDRLVIIAKQFPRAIVQRLGFLLENFTNLGVDPLCQYLNTQLIRATALIPGKDHRSYKQNKRWKVWINEEVEPDL